MVRLYFWWSHDGKLHEVSTVLDNPIARTELIKYLSPNDQFQHVKIWNQDTSHVNKI